MKRWMRVKRQVNEGELLKAVNGAGVAGPTAKFVVELAEKYPKRKDVVWPKIHEILAELKESKAQAIKTRDTKLIMRDQAARENEHRYSKIK